jgi:hypothetical protein
MRGRDRVGRAALLLATASIAGACLTGITAVEVTLADRPGLTIECRGDPVLSGTACLDWAGEVLATFPADSAEAVRIVLTDGQGAGRCTADFQAGDGAIFASATTDCPDL